MAAVSLTGLIHQPFSTTLGPSTEERALAEHLEARQNYVASFGTIAQRSQKTIDQKAYKQALLCNFSTVLVEYSEGSGPTHIKIFGDASRGDASDPSTHGERRAWQQAQEWYAKQKPKPTIRRTIIISDRHPCEDRHPACSKYFGNNGDATKVSHSNPLALDLRRDCFIYAVRGPTNDALLSELLKANPVFYIRVVAELLQTSDQKYISGLLGKIAENEPKFYAYIYDNLKAINSSLTLPIPKENKERNDEKSVTSPSLPVPLAITPSLSSSLHDLPRDPSAPFVLGGLTITPLPQRQRRPPRQPRGPLTFSKDGTLAARSSILPDQSVRAPTAPAKKPEPKPEDNNKQKDNKKGFHPE